VVCKSQLCYTVVVLLGDQMENSKPRPYVTAALLCENVLEEKTGSITIVRIADRLEWTIPSGSLPEGFKAVAQLKGFISLKSGPVKGDYTLHIKVVRPNGEIKKDMMSVPLKLLGGDQGHNTILNISLALEEEGLHWFDVYFEEDLLTRIPIMIVRKQISENGS
jgi:hypothetical protein